jgi:hypothetical protein
MSSSSALEERWIVLALAGGSMEKAGFIATTLSPSLSSLLSYFLLL